jgi:hypothetical protein
LRGEGRGEGECLSFLLLERVRVRVKKGMGSFPLTSILSLGGERKMREWGFLRGDRGGFFLCCLDVDRGTGPEPFHYPSPLAGEGRGEGILKSFTLPLIPSRRGRGSFVENPSRRGRGNEKAVS